MAYPPRSSRVMTRQPDVVPQPRTPGRTDRGHPMPPEIVSAGTTPIAYGATGAGWRALTGRNPALLRYS